MHINLLVGLAVIIAVAWLISSFRKSRVHPGKVLKDELDKRRTPQELASRAEERLAALRRERLRVIEDALKSMREALPEQDRKAGALSWTVENGREVLVRTQRRMDGVAEDADPEEGKGEFFISWDVRDFDLELFASSGSLSGVAGEYVIRWDGGGQSRESDMAEFIHMISAIIAERIA